MVADGLCGMCAHAQRTATRDPRGCMLGDGRVHGTRCKRGLDTPRTLCTEYERRARRAD